MNRSVIFLDLLRLTLNGLFNGWQAEQRLCVGDSAPYRFRCLSSEQMAERARCTVAANCSINYIISNTLLPVSFSCKQKTCLMFSLCMIHPTSSRIIICHQINFTLFVSESWKYSFLNTSHFNLILAKTRECFFLQETKLKEREGWLTERHCESETIEEEEDVVSVKQSGGRGMETDAERNTTVNQHSPCSTMLQRHVNNQTCSQRGNSSSHLVDLRHHHYYYWLGGNRTEAEVVR